MSRDPILLVEDDDGVRETLKDILEDQGYTVVAVPTVADAVRQPPPHAAAVLDIKLPDGSGMDVASALRRRQPDLALVFVTAAASLETAVDALEFGAARYLQKPCPPGVLLSVIESVMQQLRLREAAAAQSLRVSAVADLLKVLSTTLDFDETVRLGLQQIATVKGVLGAALMTDLRSHEVFVTGELPAWVTALAHQEQLAATLGEDADPGGRRVNRLLPPEGVAVSPVPIVTSTWVHSGPDSLGCVLLHHSEPPKDDELIVVLATQFANGIWQAFLHHSLAQAYKQLAASQRALIESEKQSAVGRLAAGIAHEIGTPLNIISGRAEMMLVRVDEESSMAGRLKTICAQIDRIARLVRQLLDFSRADNEERQAVWLKAVLAETLPLVETRSMKRRATIVNRVGDLKRPILASFHQLQQVVLNLILNAVDAEANEIILEATAVEGEDTVLLSVTDDGAGIPSDKLETIFEPFYTTKPRGEGTGLGLAVVRGIVRDHGGSIHAERLPEGGTAFHIRLPLGAPGGRSTSLRQRRATGST